MGLYKTNSSTIRVILVNIIVTLLLVFVIEAIAAIVLYQARKADYGAQLAVVDILLHFMKPTNPKEEALSIVLKLREQGEKAYIGVLFDPELFLNQSVYHLAHPIKATIVSCNENDYWSIYETDEIGFRNPKGQIGTNVDYIFIGDSFTEGSCVNSDETFAGVFREHGYSVLNLGRGGSGPLHQLATLREYGKLVKAKKVIWFIFTGNDLRDLRVEKTTRLIRYFEEDHFNQHLFENKISNSKAVEQFLDKKIAYQESRRQKALPLINYARTGGGSLDEYEATNVESILIIEVAEKILSNVKRMGMEMAVVIIGHNHPVYSNEIQEITINAIIEFTTTANIPYILVSREDIEKNQSDWFSLGEAHFNANGYRQVAEIVLSSIQDNK